MKKILILSLVSIFLVGCNRDYVSKKREGMKPYHMDEDSKEAQEAKE